MAGFRRGGVAGGVWLLVACVGVAENDRSAGAGSSAQSDGGASAKAGASGAAGVGGKGESAAGERGESGAGAGGAVAGSGGSARGGAGAVLGSGGNRELGGAAGSAGTASLGNGGTTGGAPSAALAEQLAALEETQKAFCTAARACCEEHGEPAMLDDCETAEPGTPYVLAALMEGSLTLNLMALERCRAAYADPANRCTMGALTAACKDVYIGHRELDEACKEGSDCDRSEGSRACMFPGGNTGFGSCKATVRASSGTTCSLTVRSGEDWTASTVYGSTDPAEVAHCYEDDGLFCDYTDPEASVCRPIIPLGGSCADAGFDACGSRARCGSDGTCVRLSDLGEPCGEGCISRFSCEEGKCVEPTWARPHYCSGERFVP